MTDMQIDLDNIPTDVDFLHRMVREMVECYDLKAREHHSTVQAKETEITELRFRIDKLTFELARLKRAHFGRSSEKINADQYQLGLEDLAATAANSPPEAAAADTGEPAETEATPTASQKKGGGRKPLPKELPREDVSHPPAPDNACPCCGQPLHAIGEEVSEVLEYQPAHFKVIRHVRPRMACRACESVHQAPAPSLPIERGRPGPGLLTQIVIAKYCDHLPLYRQQAIYLRAGVDLDRALMAFWIGKVCWLLDPLVKALAVAVFSNGGKLHTDDTTLPVLDPGRGRTKTGRLWVYVRDDRPWNGPLPPAVIYFYTETRSGDGPRTHLATFSGILQADAFSGYNRLYQSDRIVEAGCMAHARRKFYDLVQANQSPIAEEAVKRIAGLYQVEDAVRGQSPEIRRAARQKNAKPILETLKPWLETQLGRVSGRSELAGAMRYMLGHWAALTRYLDDGRIEIDNSAAERAMRNVVIGRNNYLFAGSDDGGHRAAMIYSLVETCKLNGIEPFAYLRDVISRIADHPINRIQELLPFNWKPGSITAPPPTPPPEPPP